MVCQAANGKKHMNTQAACESCASTTTDVVERTYIRRQKLADTKRNRSFRILPMPLIAVMEQKLDNLCPWVPPHKIHPRRQLWTDVGRHEVRHKPSPL